MTVRSRRGSRRGGTLAVTPRLSPTHEDTDVDLKTAIAATPWIRRGWRVVPAPLKLPLLAAGGVYLVYYYATGKHREAEAEAAAQDDIDLG